MVRNVSKPIQKGLAAGAAFKFIFGWLKVLPGKVSIPVPGVLKARVGIKMSAALTVGCVVAIAASIAGDTSQDLKTGFLLGAMQRKGIRWLKTPTRPANPPEA